MPGSAQPLSRRVLAAGAWSIAGYVVNVIVRFGSSLVMTRILLPEMFGVMSVASVVISGIAMFSDVGLKPSVIQNKEGASPLFLDTVWVTQVVRGIVLWLAACAIALIILKSSALGMSKVGSVYHDPVVPYVIGVLSLTSIFSGFESTKYLQASRGLALGRVTAIEVIAQLSAFAVTLLWALLDPSIWALVAGALSSSILRCILSHIVLIGHNNKWRWDKDSFAEIIRLGKWIFLSTSLFFLAGNGDRILLGNLVAPSTLGVYVIGFTIFSTVDQSLDRMISEIAFPALAEVYNTRPGEFSTVYYKFHRVISLIAYTCSGVLLLAGGSIIWLLYDLRYQDAGPVLRILGLALLIVPFRMTNLSLLLFGAARVYFILNAARVLAVFIGIPIGYAVSGFEGALIGIVGSYFSTLPISIYFSLRFKIFDGKRELFALPALAMGAFLGIGFNLLVSFGVGDR